VLVGWLVGWLVKFGQCWSIKTCDWQVFVMGIDRSRAKDLMEKWFWLGTKKGGHSPQISKGGAKIFLQNGPNTMKNTLCPFTYSYVMSLVHGSLGHCPRG
jgi:hypothetical protein